MKNRIKIFLVVFIFSFMGLNQAYGKNFDYVKSLYETASRSENPEDLVRELLDPENAPETYLERIIEDSIDEMYRKEPSPREKERLSDLRRWHLNPKKTQLSIKSRLEMVRRENGSLLLTWKGVCFQQRDFQSLGGGKTTYSHGTPVKLEMRSTREKYGPGDTESLEIYSLNIHFTDTANCSLDGQNIMNTFSPIGVHEQDEGPMSLTLFSPGPFILQKDDVFPQLCYSLPIGSDDEILNITSNNLRLMACRFWLPD